MTMKTYARIQDGVVAELFETDQDITELFHSDLIWVECTSVDGIAQRWTYDGTVFAAPVVPTPTIEELSVYANRHQWAIATGGYTASIGDQALRFSTDEISQSLITAKYARIQAPNPPATVNWQFPGGFVELAAADFSAAAIVIADFVQATFDALAVVLAAIQAGTITSTDEIDAYAWPATA